MAWIESHQESLLHPKTRKLSRRLDISIPAALGHLHALWYWAVDYAEDGDLSRHTDEDIAIGAMWDDDPKTFVESLIECGWMDRDGELLSLHDWHEYAGRLIDRRKANAERKRTSRARPQDVPRTDHAAAPKSAPVTGLPNPTKPDQTEPDLTEPKESGRRKRRIPDDWKPSVELREWALDEFPLVDIVDETDKFKDHFAANGKPMLDWDKAWRNWIRRSQQFARPVSA